MKYLCPYCGRTSDLTHATCDGCGAPTSVASLQGEIQADYLAILSDSGFLLPAGFSPSLAEITTLPFPKGNKE